MKEVFSSSYPEEKRGPSDLITGQGKIVDNEEEGKRATTNNHFIPCYCSPERGGGSVVTLMNSTRKGGVIHPLLSGWKTRRDRNRPGEEEKGKKRDTGDLSLAVCQSTMRKGEHCQEQRVARSPEKRGLGLCRTSRASLPKLLGREKEGNERRGRRH